MTRVEAGLVALAALVVAAVMTIGVATPSLWWDELATVSAATRSIPDLAALARTVDLVHVPYYLVMHGWLLVRPVDEFWLRLPGALSVGATVAVVYGIGRMLSGRPVAIVAAIVFVGLPRTSWTATEARSFALATLVVAVAVLLTLVAARSGRTRFVVAAGIAAAAAVLLWIYAAAAVVALLAFVVVSRPRRRTALVVALGAALVATAPFVVAVMTQRGQVGGVRPTGLALPGFVLGEQWFLTEGGVLAACFWVVVAGLAVVSIVRRRDPDRVAIRPGGLVLVAVWLVLPVAVVVGASRVLDRSLYQPRAFAFTAPALAVLVAVVAVRAIGPRLAPVLAPALAAVLVAAAIPSFIGVREVTAKGVDWRDAARIAGEQASGPTAVVFVDDRTVVGAVGAAVSAIPVGYAADLAALDDVTLEQTAAEAATLFAVRAGPDRWAGLVAGYDRVVVMRGTPDGASETLESDAVLTGLGFERVSIRTAAITSVEVWTR